MARLVGTFALAALISVAAVIALSGQISSPPQTEIGALLAEVKGLRAELNEAVGTSVRAQLLVARLSFQEQRITVVGRQLLDAQGQLATATDNRSNIQERLDRWEKDIAGGRLPVEQQREVEQQLAFERKNALPPLVRKEQELRGQESELQAVLSTEQSRWTDFNQRLDELERALLAVPVR